MYVNILIFLITPGQIAPYSGTDVLNIEWKRSLYNYVDRTINIYNLEGWLIDSGTDCRTMFPRSAAGDTSQTAEPQAHASRARGTGTPASLPHSNSILLH